VTKIGQQLIGFESRSRSTQKSGTALDMSVDDSALIATFEHRAEDRQPTPAHHSIGFCAGRVGITHGTVFASVASRVWLMALR
jgi:hypothetical protein